MKLSFVLDLKLIRFALSRWRVVDGESLYILDTTADFLVPPFASHRHTNYTAVHYDIPPRRTDHHQPSSSLDNRF